MFITLENENLNIRLNTFAGYIESIVNKKTGNEHWWHYDSSVWPRRTSVCFPVCGALTDGEYIYDAKTYALPMHGFLRENELIVADQSSNKVIMEFSSDEKTKLSYPFDFKFTLIEELSGDSFIIRYIVKNTGEKDMYYSVGSHYTYNVPIVAGETQNDYQYAFGSTQNAGRLTMENGAISGKTGDIFHGAGSLDLKGLFENGSTILELADINPKYIAVRSKKSGAFTKVEFNGFDYCVLWAPKGVSPFACIEPWTGLPDQIGHDKDITKKLGITKLNKGGSNIYTQTISVK